MYINPQDMFFVVATLCLLWVSGFLCWALYETARLMRQSNEVVTDVRDRVERVEEFVDETVEKITNLSSYAGVITKAGEALLGKMGSRHEESDEDLRPRRKAAKRLSRNSDEE
jgi:hypothetical protein